MSTVDDFLADVLPRQTEAAVALHQGNPGPLSDLLAAQDPVSFFPALAEHRTTRDDIVRTFRAIAARFTDNSTPLTFELIAADVSGDLGYVVGYEHSTVAIEGGPPVRSDLRITHIYRREQGAWRLVHRHGGGGPNGR